MVKCIYFFNGKTFLIVQGDILITSQMSFYLISVWITWFRGRLNSFISSFFTIFTNLSLSLTSRFLSYLTFNLGSASPLPSESTSGFYFYLSIPRFLSLALLLFWTSDFTVSTYLYTSSSTSLNLLILSLPFKITLQLYICIFNPLNYTPPPITNIPWFFQHLPPSHSYLNHNQIFICILFYPPLLSFYLMRNWRIGSIITINGEMKIL